MAILAKTAYLGKMAINHQNRQSVKKVQMRWPFLWKVAILAKMAYLAKMAEMALNRQNRQTVNKNSNEMGKGPFGKWRFW